MAISISVPDIPTDNASVDDRLASFSVSKQTDGAGGIVYMGTLSMTVLDSSGNQFKTASFSKPLGVSAKTALRDFIKTQFLPNLKAQEGL